MPQAYTVVWCNAAGARHVLLATKRFLGQRFGGAPSPATLLNGAGQACFPGGGVGPGETPRQAARREFQEETGVDILSPASIALYNVTDNNVTNSGAGGLPANQYSTLYVKVAALADLQNLSNAINVNIAANTPADDELQTTQVVVEAAVAAMLGPVAGVATWSNPRLPGLAGAFRVRHAGAWHNIPAGFVPPHLRPWVAAKLNAPHGWFQSMMNRLPMVAAAVAAAHAPLPAGPAMGLPPVIAPAMAGGPPPVAAPGGIGPARRTAYTLAAIAALGVAVALNYVITYLYPSDKPS